MDIQALSSIVSDILSVSLVVSNSLVNLILEWSDHSRSSNSETLSILIGDGIASSGASSDSSCSHVKDPPLSVVLVLVVSDSESELISTNMLSPVSSSEGAHFRLDLELDSVSVNLLWISESSLIDVPGLVCTVVALVPDCESVVNVSSSMYIKAEFCLELDILSVLVQPHDLLLCSGGELLHDDHSTASHFGSIPS